MPRLVPVPWQPGYKLTPDTLALLLDASRRLGSNIYLVDAWRSYAYQKRLRVGYETVGPPQYNYASDPDDPNAQNNHMRGAAFDTFKTDSATQAACRAAGLIRDASESWHWNNPNWRNMPIIPTDDATTAGNNSTPIPKGWLMALNDDEQRELLNDMRAVAAALQPGGAIAAIKDGMFKLTEIPGSTTGGNPMPGGLIRMASIAYDLEFQGPTPKNPEGGIRYALRQISNKLGITKP